MRILLLEYLHANPQWYQDAPPSIRSEGRAMLDAVAADLVALSNSVTVGACEAAAAELCLPSPVVGVTATSPARLIVAAAAVPDWDTVFLIAPEIDGTLSQLVRGFRNAGRDVIAVSTPLVETFADKWKTFQFLAVQGISTPPTVRLSNIERLHVQQDDLIVLKPRNGAGCDGILRTTFREIQRLPPEFGVETMIAQPFIEGQALSVGLIGCHTTGKVTVLPPATQNVQWVDGAPKYRGGEIPASIGNDANAALNDICHHLAKCFGRISGYVGIDFVVPRDATAPLVIEINPRLCSSYVGYRAATDHNLMSLITNEAGPPKWKSGIHRF